MGQRAATWKLWTETAGGKSDVYLACRELGGLLKTSLHESGKWHIAFEATAFEERVKGAIPSINDRFLDKWPRPVEYAPGVTLAFRIVTPWSAVSTDIEPSRTKKQVIWLSNAPEPKATRIEIFVTKPSTHTTGWPGKQGMGTSLIGSIPLQNGETIWAVYRVTDMPKIQLPGGTGAVNFFRGCSERDLRKPGSNLKTIIRCDEANGTPAMYDCRVQVDEDKATVNIIV